MHTVVIDGNEYILRCDLNAYEEILEKYGGVDEAVKIVDEEKENLKRLKFLSALLVNEHNAYTGDKTRYTETQMGQMIRPNERNTVYKAVLDAITDAFAPKN